MSYFPKGGSRSTSGGKKKPFFKSSGESDGFFKKDPKKSFGSSISSPPATVMPTYTPPPPKKPSVSKTKIMPSGTDPLSSLNKEQYIAATLPSGRNLIIASAGTGKTSTIVGRISYLLSCGIFPEEILLLTFTSKAAGEMRDRIESFVGSDTANKMMIGTFHAVALKIIKSSIGDNGLKTPRDVQLIFKSIYEHRTIPESTATKALPLAATSLYEQYGLFLNANAGKGSFVDWFEKKYPDHSPYSAIYEDIIAEFEDLKDRDRIYDFNDLLFMLRDHFKSIECPFREIIVDEYQDTNALQSSVLDDMDPESLFCVGDYDQSIYAFNGSDIEIIGSFSIRYPRARVQTLTKNYRSSKSILDGAEKLIRHNPRLYPKKIEVMRPNDPTPPILLQPVDTATQIKMLVEDIIKINDFSDTAVIYRTNASGDPVELALKERAIPCIRKGGKGIFDSKEMLSAISLLKLMFRDNTITTFLQALDISPVRSSTASIVHSALFKFDKKIQTAIVAPDPSKKSEAFSHIVSNTGMGRNAITINPSKSHLKGAQSSKWLSHPVFEIEYLSVKEADVLLELFDLITNTPSNIAPSEAVMSLLNSKILSTIFKHYASSFCRDNEGKIINEKLQKSLELFRHKMSILHKIASSHTNSDYFLKMLTMKPDVDDDGAVQLLTVHASKGLEFKNVFIIDLVEDSFPNKKLMTGGGGIEEERRLFYVAVTRPEERLVCFAPQKIKNKSTTPSRFLSEFGFTHS